ncbi:zinc dependent phospholipase C family protein [Clostridium aminobutyricum]|uniref:Zinc dependent phospholipase C family protein n=1 Tax=Clostridium aminobutyricum TaxID=33953 RepID=A0A939D9B2_CLOAM|nr:zinc dependent phospholipase C family protein [Clostridium aminobutyricum]MBN7773581.1 zinc dependent phospholipase C family protein [Clostridium aminobutyricum]
MYFFTHLAISKVLYQHFADEMVLDKRAFAFGNIKPDLPSSQRKHHTLENCIFDVYKYFNQLMDEEVSVVDFSVSLGEICHYVCDFFCYYHLDEKHYNKKLNHFLYELRLHFKLFQIQCKQKYQISAGKMEPRKDISSIILEMRKAYFSEPKSIKRDIDYAFLTAAWTCESIIYYLKYSPDLTKEAEPDFYPLLTAEGGSI